MAHVPHLYLPGPWSGPLIEIEASQDRHLRRVLRLRDGEQVSYTDGRGVIGEGSLTAAGIGRGEERQEEPRAPLLTLAVAPPRGADRAREIVEKLAELGVDRLLWLETQRGEAAPPKRGRAAAWAAGALEQSRGAWLLDLVDGFAPGGAVPAGGTVWAAVPGADPPGPVGEDLTILIGPEGGFGPGEVPSRAVPIGLGGRVLRVGTASVAAAVIGLDRLGRLAISRPHRRRFPQD